jgi:hypothetical protein
VDEITALTQVYLCDDASDSILSTNAFLSPHACMLFIGSRIILKDSAKEEKKNKKRKRKEVG